MRFNIRDVEAACSNHVTPIRSEILIFSRFPIFLLVSLKYTHRNGHRVFKISYSLDIDN